MFIHFFCLCPLGLATKLNFNMSKEAYCFPIYKIILHPKVKTESVFQRIQASWREDFINCSCYCGLRVLAPAFCVQNFSNK